MSGKKAIPEATRRAVALRYGCEPGESIEVRCHYCPATGRITWARLYSGKPGSWVHFGLTLDHVLAESAGGTADPGNIVLACKSCNSSKRDQPAEAWLTTRSRLAHDSFSEDIRENVSGKGREGNKEGKGMCVETSPSILTFCNASRATEASDENQPHHIAPAWMGEAA